MFQTTLKNLAARKLRLLTTSVAVLLGVAFMAGTLVLTDTIGKTFDELFADVYEGTDAYVRGEVAFENDVVGDQRARLDASPGRPDRRGRRRRRRRGQHRGLRPDRRQGRQADRQPRHGRSRRRRQLARPTTELNPFDSSRPGARRRRTRSSSTGTAPRPATSPSATPSRCSPRPGPVRRRARRDRHVRRHRQPRRRVVHAVHPGGRRRPSSTEPGRIDAIRVVADDGVSQAELVDRIESVVPPATEVLTGDEITEETPGPTSSRGHGLPQHLPAGVRRHRPVRRLVHHLQHVLDPGGPADPGDGADAGHRRRPTAGAGLGARRGGGRRSRRLGRRPRRRRRHRHRPEGAALGGIGIDFPPAAWSSAASTVIVSLVAGLGVSVASAVFPARRAAKVPPVAAMREVAVDDSARSRAGAASSASPSPALGAAAMAAGLFGDAGPALGRPRRRSIVFVGVAVLGPVLARPISRVLGAPAGPPAGHAGHAGPGERHAQPQAHGGHGRRR